MHADAHKLSLDIFWQVVRNWRRAQLPYISSVGRRRYDKLNVYSSDFSKYKTLRYPKQAKQKRHWILKRRSLEKAEMSEGVCRPLLMSFPKASAGAAKFPNQVLEARALRGHLGQHLCPKFPNCGKADPTFI